MISREVVAVLVVSSILGFFHDPGASQGTTHSTTGNKASLSRWSRQWLEEVVPQIITMAEKQVFTSLRTEEQRGQFIENFWKKRDPDPQTPENEFQLDHYRRIAIADKYFGAAGLDGWRTDRGKVTILLGPPDEIQRDLSSNPKETWNYWGLSNPGLPYNLEFTFVDRTGTGHYVLETSRSLTEPGNSPPDLESLRHHFDRLESLAQATRNPFENLDKFGGVVTTQVSYDRLPLQAEWLFLKGIEGRSEMTLLVSIPCSSVSGKRIEESRYYSLTLQVNVTDKSRSLVMDKSKDFNFKRPPAEVVALKDGTFDLRYSLQLKPASYRLHLVILDNFSGKTGIYSQDFAVPDFGGELSLSDITLSAEGGGSPAERTNEFKRALGVEPRVSGFGRVFKVGEEMNAKFEIYNLFLNPQTGRNALQVEYFFSQNERALAHLPAAQTEATAGRDCLAQTSFRLKNFLPGRYLLQAKATDVHSGKTASREAAFIVIP